MAMFVVLGLASAPRTDGIGKVFSSRPAQYLGRISYCIYLVHQALLVALQSLIGATLVAVLLAALSTAIVAPALYHFVEEPMRRLLNGDRSRGTRDGPTITAARADC
jgi:peptidoglycan/LPS O-acetylase OafA/YrhL